MKLSVAIAAVGCGGIAEDPRSKGRPGDAKAKLTERRAEPLQRRGEKNGKREAKSMGTGSGGRGRGQGHWGREHEHSDHYEQQPLLSFSAVSTICTKLRL
jgi:hypothetical protein